MFPNIKAEQARNGFTNADMANKLNLSRVSYESKLKSGRFVVCEIIALCHLFGCNFEYLFTPNSDQQTKGA